MGDVAAAAAQVPSAARPVPDIAAATSPGMLRNWLNLRRAGNGRRGDPG